MLEGREGDLIEPSVDVLDVGNWITRSPPNKDHFTLHQHWTSLSSLLKSINISIYPPYCQIPKILCYLREINISPEPSIFTKIVSIINWTSPRGPLSQADNLKFLPQPISMILAGPLTRLFNLIKRRKCRQNKDKKVPPFISYKSFAKKELER